VDCAKAGIAEKAMGHESQIELWTPLERRSALLVSELAGFVVKQAMKTAGRGNPNRWTLVSSNRAHGAVGQKPSCSFTGAAKQEKFQPLEACFFLTSPFIELGRYCRDFALECDITNAGCLNWLCL
jgi:hypothetical protein